MTAARAAPTGARRAAPAALPPIGVGAAPLGNLYRPMSDAAAQATLAAALAAGLDYIDTAPHYGRGLSERRVGEAVRGHPGVRVSTKVGRLLDHDPDVVDDRERDGFRSPMPFRAHYDYSHDGVLRSHDDSLARLGLDRVDLLFVHDIGRLTHGEAHARHWQALTEGGGFRALERLRDEGAIRGFGVGANETAAIVEAMAAVRLDVVLLAGRYTLLEQAALDDLLPACAAAGTQVVIGGPYNSGILATGARAGATPRYDYAPAPPAIVAKVAAIEAVCARHDVPLAAAALALPLAHPQVASVIPGLDSPEQVARTVALHRWPIPADLWAELRADGLLRADAPVPA